MQESLASVRAGTEALSKILHFNSFRITIIKKQQQKNDQRWLKKLRYSSTDHWGSLIPSSCGQTVHLSQCRPHYLPAEPPADINDGVLASLNLNGAPRPRLMPSSDAGLPATVYLSPSPGSLWHLCPDVCHPVKFWPYLSLALFFSFFPLLKKTNRDVKSFRKKAASQWSELAVWFLLPDHHQLCWCKWSAQTLKSVQNQC